MPLLTALWGQPMWPVLHVTSSGSPWPEGLHRVALPWARTTAVGMGCACAVRMAPPATCGY